MTKRSEDDNGNDDGVEGSLRETEDLGLHKLTTTTTKGMGGGMTESELGSDCAIERQNQHHQQSTLMGVTEAFDPFEYSNTGAITTTTSATTGVENGKTVSSPDQVMAARKQHKGNQLPPSSSPSSVFIHL